MDTPLIVLFWLAVALGIVTVVGHGIWVLLGAMLGQQPTGRSGVSSCPVCGARLLEGRCPVCNWPAPRIRRDHTPLALSALQDQLDRFVRMGLIDRDSHQRLIKALDAEREQRLAAPLVAEAVTTHAARTTTAHAAPTQPAMPLVLPPVDQTYVSPREIVRPVHPLDDEYSVAPLQPVVVSPQRSEAPAAHTPEERVRDYAASRAHATADEAAHLAAPAAPPRAPRAPLSSLLAAFMEEKNIRWGELVGGLLIVCCSIALVISFWAQIAERPLLKFLLFNGVTAALFGLGLYSAHRWKLETTSRAVLTISMLLVPLNFLAIAAFSADAPANLPLTIVGEAISVALFAALVYWGGRMVVPDAPLLLVLSVIWPSIVQLLVRRWIDPSADLGRLLAIGSLPIVGYVALNGLAIWRKRRVMNVDETTFRETMALVGISTFATLMPIGLLLFKTGRVEAALHQLAILVTGIGIAPLAVGLFLGRRMTKRRDAGFRTAALAVAVAGAAALVAGAVLAWPTPMAMLPTAALAAVVFFAIAVAMRMPEAHWAGIVCLALAMLTAWHVTAGRLVWQGQPAVEALHVFISGSSGQALGVLAGAVFIAAAATARLTSRIADGRALTIGGVAVSIAALALVGWFGFAVAGDPLFVTWIFAGFGAAACAAATRWKYVGGLWTGAALILAASIQGIVFLAAEQWALAMPWTTAVALDATLMAVAALGCRQWSERIGGRRAADVFAQAAACVSSVVALLVAAGSTGYFEAATAGPLAIHWMWLGVIWLGISLLDGWSWFFLAFQAAFTFALWFGVGSGLEARPWFATAMHPWLDPWTLECEGIAIALLSLLWILARWAIGNRRATSPTAEAGRPQRALAARFADLLHREHLAADRIILRVVLVALVALAAYAAWPGIAQELTPYASTAIAGASSGSATALPLAQFEFLGIPATHAAGYGSWILLAVISAALAVEMIARRSTANWPALVIALAAACPLAGSWWTNEMAVASATRWLAAMFLIVGTGLLVVLPHWKRRGVAPAAPVADGPAEGAARSAFIPLAWTIVIAPFIAAVLMMANHPARGSINTVHPALGALTVIWLAVALVAALLPNSLGRFLFQAETAAPTTPITLSLGERVQLLLVFLGGVPAVALGWYAVTMAAGHAPIGSPASNSIFARAGSAVSYAGPILLSALALVACGIRRRSPSLILCGGVVVNFAATIAYVLSIAEPSLDLNASRWIELAQLNAIVSAGFALVWTAALLWRSRSRTVNESRSNWPLITQVGIAAACNAAVLVPAWLSLVVDPIRTQSLLEVADAWGWAAAIVTAAAIFAAGRLTNGFRGTLVWAMCLSAATTLVAWTACRWDTGNWLGYHFLLAAHLAAPVLIAAVGWFGDGRFARRNWITNLALIATTIGVSLGLRTLHGDPAQPWWAIGALATQASLVVWLAYWSLRRGLLHVAALFINAAASIWWLHRMSVGTTTEWLELIEINIIALAAPVAVWLILELRRLRPQLGEPSDALGRFERLAPAHRVAARLSLAALAIVVGIRLAATAVQVPGLAPVEAPEWLALAAVAMAGIACLWDAGARASVAALYFVGLIAVGVVLDALRLEPKWLWWGGDLAVAAYALATSALWWRRDELRSLADRVRIPLASQPYAELQWLAPLNCMLVVIVTALSFGFVLEFDDWALRIAAAKAILFQMATIALLAHGERRWRLQQFSLVLGALGAVAVGWAYLDPRLDDVLLYRTVAAAAALAITVVIYGLGLGKLLRDENDWLKSAKSLAPVLVAIDAAAILLVLGVEAARVVEFGHVTIAPAAMMTTGAVLIGLCAACLAAGLLPGRDPLGLSERGRRAYVYAAEVLLALLFVHIRLTKPEWFHGFFEQYWPLVVQAIAFIGVGVGEWFRRRRWSVVGEPLATTGAFLPLLPVIGYWILPTRVDYSVLLLVVGLLYGGLSVARRSFGFGLVALAAANGSLWYFLNRQDGYRFLDHPQLWLIPPALCVLFAAHLNRRQLSPAQTTAIRYGATIVLYVSSTADIFLQGVARAPWLPLVLGGISLVGVFAGILLRIRAFLILGTSFLLVALATVIWYAAVDLQQTWLWSASGIVTGVLILVVFAIFEKQRQAVLGVIEKLKQWQP